MLDTQRPPDEWQLRFEPEVRGAIEGKPIALKSVDSAYGEYLERIRLMIKQKWGYPCAKDVGTRHCDYKPTEVVVEFGIVKSGHVRYVMVLQPSEWSIYNDYAVNAVRLGAPFPPVPRELMARAAPESGEVRIVATFHYGFVNNTLNQEIR